MSGTHLPRTIEGETAVARISQSLDEMEAIRTFVLKGLVEGIDFGKIPGCGDQPALLQPGAQKINMYLNVYDDPEITATELGEGHVEYRVRTRLVSRVSDRTVGIGVGSCSTLETKYTWRTVGKTCPNCGAQAVFKGAEKFGGGYFCNRKKDGCGRNFRDADSVSLLNSLPAGKVPNENIHDTRNTVLKMAVKRALVAASLSIAALSELFTQDIEEGTFSIDKPAEKLDKPAEKVAAVEAQVVRQGNDPASLAELRERVIAKWSKLSPPENDQAVLDREEQIVFAMIARAIEAGKLQAAAATGVFEVDLETLESLFARDPKFVIREAAKFIRDVERQHEEHNRNGVAING